MNIKDFQDQKFWLIRFNQQFGWEVEEDGFVIIIGEDHFAAFEARVDLLLQDEKFHFYPRCKLTDLETEECSRIHRGMTQEFLEEVVEKAREISFEEFGMLNRVFGVHITKDAPNHLHHSLTNQYTPRHKGKKYDFLSWGYGSNFYNALMDEYEDEHA